MKPWTAKEEKQLRKEWGVLLADEVAKKHGRSVNSVTKHASKMGLKSKLTRWNAAGNSKELKELIEFGYCATDIAKQLGKTTKNIYNTVRDRKDISPKWYRMLLKNTKLQTENRGVITPVYKL